MTVIHLDATNKTPTFSLNPDYLNTQITVWGAVTTVTAMVTSANGAPLEPVIDAITGEPVSVGTTKLTFRISGNSIWSMQLTTDATGDYSIGINQW